MTHSLYLCKSCNKYTLQSIPDGHVMYRVCEHCLSQQLRLVVYWKDAA